MYAIRSYYARRKPAIHLLEPVHTPEWFAIDDDIGRAENAALDGSINFAPKPLLDRGLFQCMPELRITSYNVCYTKLLRFGLVLDSAGGNRNLVAWGLAFASIGIFGALAPAARWIYRGRRIRSA